MSTVWTGNDVEKCKCGCGCGKNGYRRSSSAKASTIWNIRNDSSNVSSLLAPDLTYPGDESDVATTIKTNRTILSKQTAHRSAVKTILSDPVVESGPIHCESCYCRDSPNLPALDLRPKDDRKDETSSITRTFLRHHRNTTSHGVRRIPKESTKSRDKPVASRKFSKDDLDLTRPRHHYEMNTGELHRILETDERTETTEDRSGAYKFLRGKSPGDDRAIETREAFAEQIDFERGRMSYKDFKELARFRKDNYFETHSTVHLSSSPARPDHKCLHKFVINDRFLPEPLNSDTFGVSRCDVCNKPMETFKSVKPPPPQPRKRKQSNRVKRIYEYNLAPPRINIGCGNETVQIKVPEKVGRECLREQSGCFKLNRMGPGNSYALRYQKGRL